jgi:crotonobetainyl-CoA:carnitine CoA-transferase CaiB-like acyl-CoA transferase
MEFCRLRRPRPGAREGGNRRALSGILAALVHRARTGEGQYIDTSLVEAGIALSVWEATEYLSGRGVPQPTGSAHRLSAPYQAIRCADGYITLGAANDRLFERLCAVLGHREWAGRAEFANQANRVAGRKALADLIETVTSRAPRRHWLDLFEANEIPCGPINDYASALGEPQTLAREMVCETDHPTLGRLRTLGSPLKMSKTPPVATGRAPLLGEHTTEVLLEAGCTHQEIEAVRLAAE